MMTRIAALTRIGLRLRVALAMNQGETALRLIERALQIDGNGFAFLAQKANCLLALQRDKELNLLPLLVYVFTHELTHIVRFCNFYQRFELSGEERRSEEKIVHNTTFEILKDLSLPRITYILDAYRNHRICDLISN